VIFFLFLRCSNHLSKHIRRCFSLDDTYAQSSNTTAKKW
jgi:hypothetical protein